MSLVADAETPTLELRTAAYAVPVFTPRADAPVPVQRGSFPLRVNLRHGGSVDVVLRWQILGVQEAPLLIVLGGISAHRQLAANALDASEGWWPQQVQQLLLGRYDQFYGKRKQVQEKPVHAV